jgi:hypothetical protein
LETLQQNQYACKVFTYEQYSSFKQEIEAANIMINSMKPGQWHPNIVRFYDSGMFHIKNLVNKERVNEEAVQNEMTAASDNTMITTNEVPKTKPKAP